MRISGRSLPGTERIAAAFADSGKRAAFMPYLMGGFPDLATSRGIGEAYAAAGADLIELGVPFSDPLADGPAIQAAGTAALRAGVTVEEVLRLGGALAASVPVVVMAYANQVLARGPECCTARCRRSSRTTRARCWRPTRSQRASTTRARARSTPTCATAGARATRP